MIDRLRGKLIEAEPTHAVVDVMGVCYSLIIPVSTYDQLPKPESDIELITHLHVREGVMELYGFGKPHERELFQLLITVSGIGCRLALNVLSSMSVETFCNTISEGNINQLAKVNGLGKRSAERLVVELREKVAEIEPQTAYQKKESLISQEAQDAVAALETLGFKNDKARSTVQKLCDNLPASEQTAQILIRKALKQLNT
ncbi:MAG: Holliday junction branch migration protein RuvA [Verrucomicrobiota bacterium]